jgi:hypothetical protein
MKNLKSDDHRAYFDVLTQVANSLDITYIVYTQDGMYSAPDNFTEYLAEAAPDLPDIPFPLKRSVVSEHLPVAVIRSKSDVKVFTNKPVSRIDSLASSSSTNAISLGLKSKIEFLVRRCGADALFYYIGAETGNSSREWDPTFGGFREYTNTSRSDTYFCMKL